MLFLFSLSLPLSSNRFGSALFLHLKSLINYTRIFPSAKRILVNSLTDAVVVRAVDVAFYVAFSLKINELPFRLFVSLIFENCHKQQHDWTVSGKIKRTQYASGIWQLRCGARK